MGNTIIIRNTQFDNLMGVVTKMTDGVIMQVETGQLSVGDGQFEQYEFKRQDFGVYLYSNYIPEVALVNHQQRVDYILGFGRTVESDSFDITTCPRCRRVDGIAQRYRLYGYEQLTTVKRGDDGGDQDEGPYLIYRHPDDMVEWNYDGEKDDGYECLSCPYTPDEHHKRLIEWARWIDPATYRDIVCK